MLPHNNKIKAASTYSSNVILLGYETNKFLKISQTARCNVEANRDSSQYINSSNKVYHILL